jgi:endonuclease/exonuclease/phosphatase family metal-dependent hydrolase
MRAALLALCVSFVSGCTSRPEARVQPCTSAANLPTVHIDGDGREYLDLSVLIYNVEGLPWPARKRRGPSLDRIAAELERLRAAGMAPDIVLLQEAFSQQAKLIATRAGYPNIIYGPGARDKRREAHAPLPSDFRAERRLLKGERTPKLLSSGLVVLSEFPVMSVQTEPFSRHACAGFDCLANKGVMLARVWIPGMPSPLDLFTTHMNSRSAAGVNLERADAAHRYQTDQSADFLARARDDSNPLIFGGDFNMKNSPGRLDYFSYRKPYHIVRHYCTVVTSDCDVRVSWDGDASWLDTQDLQGFDDGATVKLRPIVAEAMFDGPNTGGKLSDHDGYKVVYRLSWRNGAAGRGAPQPKAARSAGQLACLPGPPRRSSQ